MNATKVWGAACALLFFQAPVRGADRDRVEDADFGKVVRIEFDGATANVVNEAGVGVSYGAGATEILINSEVEGVEYVLSGAAPDGCVEISSVGPAKVTLKGLDLASGSGPALSLHSTARGFVVLEEGTTNAVADGASYTRTGSGAIYSTGPLVISGGGALEVRGLKSHGISGESYVRVLGGEISVPAAVKDAVHAKEYFRMDHGRLSLAATGDGIDAGAGYVEIHGGSISILSAVDDTKGIAADGPLSIHGGLIDLIVRGTQSKAIKSDSDITISGGVVMMGLSGGVYLESVAGTSGSYVDPSYCTGIKGGGNLLISGGEIDIVHSGLAGKGISVDGNITISGGKTVVATSGGSSAVFTNASNARDIAASDCVKADGNLVITGGVVSATSSGTAGDAISCEGAATIGVAGVEEEPVISANTSGARVLVSGSGQNADYANPKSFKAEGAIVMNGGVFRATAQQAGGEGMESKSTVTINGGLVEIQSYDDSINASTNITINGGTIYCYSSGNDGIDSNGTMRITGGTIISSGSNSPEEGFDCDQNNFTITGGVVVGTGGATSTPTASTSTQRSVIYRGAGTLNVILHVRSANGSVLVYKIPRTYSGGGGGGGGGGSSAAMTMLFSTPGLVSGTTYTLLSGATVTGGTEFHGFYTGATVTGGTTLKTFSTTNMVTTVQ